MNDLLKKARALYEDPKFRAAMANEFHWHEAQVRFGYRGSYEKFVWMSAYSKAREMEHPEYQPF